MAMNTDGHLRDSQRSTAVTGGISRRAALGRLAGTGLSAALLATLGRDRTLAQATPAPEAAGQQPNGFTFDGAGTHINYGTTSMTGRPTFTYRGTYGEHAFDGDEIHTEGSAAVGGLVSVLIDAVPDSHTVWLTLLLPAFNPVQIGDPPIAFASLAVLTTHLTTEAGPGPIDGPLQTYEVVALAGTAHFGMP
jgi:hypothetical protein